MAGPGSLRGLFDHGIHGDHFMEYLDLVDFPMESLEGGGLHRGDWDAKMQALGTIFMEAKPLLGSPLASSVGNNGSATSNVIEESSELKPPIKSVKEASEASIQSIKEASKPSIPLQNDSSSHVSESGVFQSLSPVSLPESTSSCSGEKSVSTSSENLIPARMHTEHSESSTIDPQLGMPPISCTGKRELRKRKFSQPSGAFSNSETTQNSSQRPAASKKCSVASSSVPSRRKKYTKQCLHCGTGKTPQWRGGPMGPKTLCNACGVQYRFGRLFPEYRPAASPSFVPSLHSNSHLKVIEMRKKATQKSSTVEAETPMPPPPPPPHKAVEDTTLAEI